jgi:hypothetical protein
MPYVTCPTCSERGKIPPNLVGTRIKCRKCGLSFQVSAPAAKAGATAGAPGSATGLSAVPSAVAEPLQGIEVEGLDASSWALPTETAALLKAEAASPTATATVDPAGRAEAGSAFIAEPRAAAPAGREYKLLTSRDKIFEGKFEFARLEEALNLFARQGWTAKSMLAPHAKNFAGVVEEVIVVLLERG